MLDIKIHSIIISILVALPSLLCAEEQKGPPLWVKEIFLSEYCFIAEVVKTPNKDFNDLKPMEFFWGKRDEFLQHRLKVGDIATFPVGSKFFIYYKLQDGGGISKFYCRLKISRDYENTKITLGHNAKKIRIKDFRELALQRPRKK